jgi:hypothetical protein
MAESSAEAPAGEATSPAASIVQPPLEDSTPNERISFDLVAHAAFPPASATAAEVAAFLDSALEDCNMTQLLYGVCEVPILSPFGQQLLDARTAPLLGRGGAGVGSMHAYGTDILELFPLLAKELGERLRPLFALLYRPPGAPLPTLHMYSAHCIAYGLLPTRERALKLHVDASLYTATICVRATPDLRGTELVFHGQKGIAHPKLQQLQARFALAQRAGGVDVRNGEDVRNQVAKLPRAGHALLHLGAHPHRTLPVEGGERISWVLWWHESEGSGGMAGEGGGGQ